MKAVCLLVAFVGVGACVSAHPNLSDNVIVPGERVGDITIGMPLSTLLAVKGTPTSTVPMANSEGATTYAFDGISVGARDDVYWIIADSTRYHTANGVGPGAEQIFARASFGKPACVVTRDDVTIYDYDTFYFSVDNSTGKVKQLGVLKKTEWCKKS